MATQNIWFCCKLIAPSRASGYLPPLRESELKRKTPLGLKKSFFWIYKATSRILGSIFMGLSLSLGAGKTPVVFSPLLPPPSLSSNCFRFDFSPDTDTLDISCDNSR